MQQKNKLNEMIVMNKNNILKLHLIASNYNENYLIYFIALN